MEKYVVISTKKLNGTRVMCIAGPKEDAEATLKQLEVHERTKDLGPFTVVLASEAETKNLYGNS